MNNKDAIKLFLRREGRELHGKRQFNLWLLTAIFFVSILVIGFGSASISYLRYKMDDPFINWVDINIDQLSRTSDNIELKSYLSDPAVQERFRLIDPQANYVFYQSFKRQGKNVGMQHDGRSVGAYGLDREGNRVQNPILAKILYGDNAIEVRDLPLSDDDLGLIITEEMALSLGYEHTPTFIPIWKQLDVEACEAVGLGRGDNGSYAINLPVVAVVKQLPGMNAFLFTSRYWHEIYSLNPFDPTLGENNDELLLCGSEKDLEGVAAQVDKSLYSTRVEPYNESWKEMWCLHIRANSMREDRVSDYNRLFNELSVASSEITRVYHFRAAPDEGGRNQFYSIQLLTLDSIRSFAADLKKKCGIQLEMTNVDAKENFHFVQRMGMVLSVSIILIVALFILVFIYFLLRSHFQKIERNLGTFKAFGVSTLTLDGIYVRLLLRMTLMAYGIGGVAALAVALLWRVVRVIEPGYAWINVIVWQNGVLLVLSMVAAVAATLWVSHSRLKNTPGDLIYSRK